MHNIVIVNTSPIFYLYRLGHLNILEKLYGEIVIPESVFNELEEGRRIGEDVPDISTYNWISVKAVAIPDFIKVISDLGRGEAEVLALGCEEKEPLLIIDDGLARKTANLKGFRLTGTAGILLKAKRENHIREIKSLLDRLKDINFYLSDKLIAEIIKIAGET